MSESSETPGVPDSPSGTPEPPSRGHRLRDTTVLLAVSMLAFGVGMVVFNFVLMPRLVHTSGTVEVPDLRQLTFEQAEREVQVTGLTLSRAGERFDPATPRGFVLTQDPAPGTPVRGSRRVMVVLSLGEESSSVPELSGETRRNAELLLARAGLEVGAVTRTQSDRMGDGLIIATDPPAETLMPRNGKVALLLSTGPGVEEYVMPDLIGREIGGVRRQLEALGLRVLTPPAAAEVGPIVAQDPPVGARIGRNAVVTLQASGRVIR